MEPHSKQLHVSLAYQFVPDVRDHLELLARKIDLKAPARWDLRLYSRDQRIAHCQVRPVADHDLTTFSYLIFFRLYTTILH